MSMTFHQFNAIVSYCKCRPYEFLVTRMAKGYCIQATHYRVDSATMKWGYGNGRKFYMSKHVCRNEVVQTCLLASLLMAEHETREQFRYHGKTIYNPHLDPDHLMKFRDEFPVDVRDLMPGKE